MVLKIGCDTIKLQKVTYDVIFMTSQILRHRKYVIKMTLQNFSFKSPSLSKILVALLGLFIGLQIKFELAMGSGISGYESLIR